MCIPGAGRTPFQNKDLKLLSGLAGANAQKGDAFKRMTDLIKSFLAAEVATERYPPRL
jgi:hypothetical protein